MNITPLNEYILLQAAKDAETTQGGMVIATVRGEKTESVALRGKVLSVPKKVTAIKVGDQVMVAKWEVHKAYVGGLEYIVAKEEHVLLKIEE